MGKIFGISDLSVSTIMTPFEPIVIKPEIIKTAEKVYDGKVDNKFLIQKINPVNNPVVKKRYGIGKLLKHFSKAKQIDLNK